jgi:uncharacterized coiled-coil DUF342 family protein
MDIYPNNRMEQQLAELAFEVSALNGKAESFTKKYDELSEEIDKLSAECKTSLREARIALAIQVFLFVALVFVKVVL